MIYSPSQTKQFLTCPVKRQLEQEGWTQRMLGKKDWIGYISQGVHAGLAYLHQPLEIPPLQAGVLTKGKSAFEAYYGQAVQDGRMIPPSFYKGEGLAQVERCLDAAMKDPNNLLPTGFEVTGVEQALEGYSCILDVVGTYKGKPSFIDWKVKAKLRDNGDSRNKHQESNTDKELERYRYEWKEARHYPWALSEVMKERVEYYFIVMFVLEPRFKVIEKRYEVNWKMVERWMKGCKDSEFGMWETMEDLSGPLGPQWQSNNCHPGQYGFECDYLHACWQYDMNREAMAKGEYIQIERRR